MNAFPVRTSLPARRPWAALRLRFTRWIDLLIGALALALVGLNTVRAAINPADWRLAQPLNLALSGLIKVPLAAETLAALRPEAADLRLIDPAQSEIGWFLERPLRFQPDAPIRPAKSFNVTVSPHATVVLVETGITDPLGGLALETGNGSFLKAVDIEGMMEGGSWQPITTGVPFYNRYQGESRRETSFTAHKWSRLRITLDDSKTDAVVITGVHLLVVTSGPTATVTTQSVPITARDEGPEETRLTLDMGGANLDVASFLVTTDAGFFARPTSVRVRTVEHGEWVERLIARGLLYRDGVGTNAGSPTNPLPPNITRLEIGESVPGREVILVIHNGDNPPLPVSAIGAELQPMRLVFFARQAGRYQLLVGNPAVNLPHYDLAAFADQLKTAAPNTGVFDPLGPNPLFRPPTVLPDPYALGATLNVSDWSLRKAIPIVSAGAQVLELDPEILVHGQFDLADLRLVSDGRQRPFVREPNPVWRTLTVEPTSDDPPKQTTVGRWKLKLPYAALPIVAIAAESSATLFDRSVTVYETIDDSRGDKVNRVLGEARWRRAPGEPKRSLKLPLAARPTTDTFWIEIRNQDNAPIPLTRVELTYVAPRIRFLAPVAPATSLYYGNPKATAPSYDLELVAGALFVAETVVVTGAAEEVLRGGTWTRLGWSQHGQWLFWGALGIVVALLLGVMRRLLPPVVPPNQ